MEIIETVRTDHVRTDHKLLRPGYDALYDRCFDDGLTGVDESLTDYNCARRYKYGYPVQRCVRPGTKFSDMDELIEFLAKIALGHATVDCSRHAAAVLDERGRIVQIGFNKFLCSKNDPKCWMKRRPGLQTQHAEINACAGLPKSLLRKCSIVIVRARLGRGAKPYDITCARPCAWCADWLLSVGVRRVYHTVSSLS